MSQAGYGPANNTKLAWGRPTALANRTSNPDGLAHHSDHQGFRGSEPDCCTGNEA